MQVSESELLGRQQGEFFQAAGLADTPTDTESVGLIGVSERIARRKLAWSLWGGGTLAVMYKFGLVKGGLAGAAALVAGYKAGVL